MMPFAKRLTSLKMVRSSRLWLLGWAAVVSRTSAALLAADAIPSPSVQSRAPETPGVSMNLQIADPRSLHSQFRARLAAEVLTLSQEWKSLGTRIAAAGKANSTANSESMDTAVREIKGRTLSLVALLKPLCQEIEAIPLREIPSYVEVEVETQSLLAMKAPLLMETVFRPTRTNVSAIFIKPKLVSASLIKHSGEFIQRALEQIPPADPLIASIVSGALRDLHFDLDPMTSEGITLISVELKDRVIENSEKLERFLDYRSLTRVTPAQIDVEASTVTLCIDPRDFHGPHIKPGIHLYVSPGVLEARSRTGTARYPLGSMLVKEKFNLKGDAKPSVITVMEKVADRGRVEDWRFYMVRLSDRSFVPDQGKVSCVNCHSRFDKTDYVSPVTDSLVKDYGIKAKKP